MAAAVDGRHHCRVLILQSGGFPLTKPLAYSYIRMSTDIQLKGDSLRRQTERSKKYAQDHNLQLVEDLRLEDIGVSAFKGDNVSSGALGKFLDAVKAGRILKGSYLLVESFDRLSRQKLNASVALARKPRGQPHRRS
ncbi:recombinase family protein [Mesorhizobium salmacidum]|uniref:recombinase family protein n=1 Tax=Mesorhizobium salmacidum TaxID=3015171 RepID=UPI0039F5DB92